VIFAVRKSRRDHKQSSVQSASRDDQAVICPQGNTIEQNRHADQSAVWLWIYCHLNPLI